MNMSEEIPRGYYVETKIKSSNKGFEMLAKLGWAEGQPLGYLGMVRLFFVCVWCDTNDVCI